MEKIFETLIQYFLGDKFNPKEKSRSAITIIIIIVLSIFASVFFDALFSLIWFLLLFFLVRQFITSGDTFSSGNPENKFINAFQARFPSKYIMEQYNVGKEEAESLWFKNVFNKWANKNSPYLHIPVKTATCSGNNFTTF